MIAFDSLPAQQAGRTTDPIALVGAAHAPREASESRAFSALEWSVIADAQRDSLLSLEQPGRISLAMGRIFGGHRNTPRPEPRLEALRRISVLAWYRSYALPTAEIARFKAAGFSSDQLETLLKSIAVGRAPRTRRIEA